MYNSNVVIEEVIFNPRLIPLSMRVPMKKVVCGARFVLSLTQVSCCMFGNFFNHDFWYCRAVSFSLGVLEKVVN